MKLQYEKTLSNFAFNVNLRHYSKGGDAAGGAGDEEGAGEEEGAGAFETAPRAGAGPEGSVALEVHTGPFKVGRCSLTPC